MTQAMERRFTLDELPAVSQKLRLVCDGCGREHEYDVGTIHVWLPEGDTDEAAPGSRSYGFSNYFRCRDCGSSGPWEAVDHLNLTGMLLRAKVTGGDERMVFATPKLFDGTIVQSPAMGEDYLLRLIEGEPGNAFFRTRLGNLFRGCGEKSQAAAWYARALALDAADLEARYHLLCFAADDSDHPAAIEHARTFVRHLLDGRKAASEELTHGLALSVVEMLRQAPSEVCDELVRVPRNAAAPPPETAFIRSLLDAKGDEDAIVHDAAERLLRGDCGPAPSPLSAVIVGMADGTAFDLVPSLRELVEKERLDVRRLTVAATTDAHGRIRIEDRHAVMLFDGKRGAMWKVPSLRELFRGDKSPPPDMDRYPPQYDGCFFSIEKHVLTACEIEGNKTDQEMEPIYSALRRRPDGRNHLGSLHDFLWQAAALTLGMQRLSESEFTALIEALERSVRRWALRPVSRNYVGYLRKNSR
jgi:hypothetical protein